MPSDLLKRLREIIEADPRTRSAGETIAVSVEDDGRVTLEGEVADVAAKRVATDRVSRLPDVFTVVDHLRVAPDHPVDDEQIRRRLLDLLFEDPCFGDYELSGTTAETRKLRSSSRQALRIDFSVSDGVVSLSGRVSSPLHKRLAGVLAWWTPGSRDVRNALNVDAEGDADLDLEEAVKTVIARDPLLARELEVAVRDCVVYLRGAVSSDEERHAAETDAWYVAGVRDVVNEIAVEL